MKSIALPKNHAGKTMAATKNNLPECFSSALANSSGGRELPLGHDRPMIDLPKIVHLRPSLVRGVQIKGAGVAKMDDLDRIALDVAVSIIAAETESPGSQSPSSVRLAEQTLAQLQPQAGEQPKTRTASGS